MTKNKPFWDTDVSKGLLLLERIRIRLSIDILAFPHHPSFKKSFCEAHKEIDNMIIKIKEDHPRFFPKNH